jgi:hypothetical protein
MQPDGTPGWAGHLVKGTDFTSDCARDEALTDNSRSIVVLVQSHLYIDADLHGYACVIEPGTELTTPIIHGANGGISIASPDLEAACQERVMFSKDMVSDWLLLP